MCLVDSLVSFEMCQLRLNLPGLAALLPIFPFLGCAKQPRCDVQSQCCCCALKKQMESCAVLGVLGLCPWPPMYAGSLLTKYPGDGVLGCGDATLPVPVAGQGDSLRSMSLGLVPYLYFPSALCLALGWDREPRRVVLPFQQYLLMVGVEGEGQRSSTGVTACTLMQGQS